MPAGVPVKGSVKVVAVSRIGQCKGSSNPTKAGAVASLAAGARIKPAAAPGQSRPSQATAEDLTSSFGTTTACPVSSTNAETAPAASKTVKVAAREGPAVDREKSGARHAVAVKARSWRTAPRPTPLLIPSTLSMYSGQGGRRPLSSNVEGGSNSDRRSTTPVSTKRLSVVIEKTLKHIIPDADPAQHALAATKQVSFKERSADAGDYVSSYYYISVLMLIRHTTTYVCSATRRAGIRGSAECGHKGLG